MSAFDLTCSIPRSFQNWFAASLRLPDGTRKEQLRLWLDRDIAAWFGDRLLPISLDVAERWGRLVAEHRPLPTIDSLLAATALHHGLRLVTRNIADFQFAGLTVINPWGRE